MQIDAAPEQDLQELQAAVALVEAVTCVWCVVPTLPQQSLRLPNVKYKCRN